MSRRRGHPAEGSEGVIPRAQRGGGGAAGSRISKVGRSRSSSTSCSRSNQVARRFGAGQPQLAARLALGCPQGHTALRSEAAGVVVPPIAHRGEEGEGASGPTAPTQVSSPAPPSGSPAGLRRSAEPRHLPLSSWRSPVVAPSRSPSRFPPWSSPLTSGLLYRRPGSHAERTAAAAIGTSACCSLAEQGPPIQPGTLKLLPPPPPPPSQPASREGGGGERRRQRRRQQR